MPASRAAADDPQPLPIGISFSMWIREWRDLAIFRFEHFAVGSDDQMVFHPAADLRVAALGGNKEVGGALGAQAEMEIEREGRCVERGTQVGGGRRQRQAQRTVRRYRTRRHSG